VGAVALPLGIAVLIAEVWPAPELVVSSEVADGVVVAGPLEAAVVIALGASNPGRPMYFASPNVYPFPSCSSFGELVAGVFVGSSIVALPNDAAYSHSSSLRVPLYKKRERFDNGPNPNYSFASDTNALPTDATTSHRRKRWPHRRQGRHRHTSQVSLPSLEVRQIRWVEAEECLHLHQPFPPSPSLEQGLS